MPFPVAVFTPTSLSLPKISLFPFDTGLSCAYFSLLLIKLLQERKCINVMVKAKERQQLIVHCTQESG